MATSTEQLVPPETAVDPIDESKQPTASRGPGAVAYCGGKVRSLLLALGPGLVTGASDDDPSGIATYSQVGAQFGYGMLWTMVLTYPLMTAIQEGKRPHRTCDRLRHLSQSTALLSATAAFYNVNLIFPERRSEKQIALTRFLYSGGLV